MLVEKCSYRDYIFLFGKCRNGYADLAARRAADENSLYMLCYGRAAYGFICVTYLRDYLCITHIAVLPQYRGGGFAQELLRFALSLGSKVIMAVSEGLASYQAIRHILLKIGFKNLTYSWIYHSTSREDDFLSWFSFMAEKGWRMCNVLKRSGLKAVAFRDLTSEQIKYINNSPYNDYRNVLTPSAILNKQCGVELDVSCAACAGEKIVSYVLAHKYGEKSITFDNISVDMGYVGMGTILLPFAYSMEAVRRKGYVSVSYKMYSDNKRANAFRKKLLGKLTGSRTRCAEFVFEKGEVNND